MSSRRNFMKAVVGVPVASAFWPGRLGAFGLGDQTGATGHPAAEWKGYLFPKGCPHTGQALDSASSSLLKASLQRMPSWAM